MTYAISKTNQELLAKSEGLKKVYEHARDYLTVTLTLPLGNKALKKVHTGQWLFTDLPAEFDLANWTVLAEALNSNATRFAGYVKNRWYVENVDIVDEVKGKSEMKLTLNAFASSKSSYTEMAREMQKAYTDAVNNQNKNTSNNDKNKSNALAKNNNVLNQSNIKKYKIPKYVYQTAEKICKGKKSDKDKAYALYKWMDAHVQWEYYSGHRHNETSILKRGKGNCVDNSRTYRLLCLSVGLNCVFMQAIHCCSGSECANHEFNKVYINGKGVIVDCGRTRASWGSHWGKCSSVKESNTSW